jgi:hypothetical protein
MSDAGLGGLGKSTKLKYIKGISPTGAFPDPWGGAFDKLDKTIATLRESQLSKFEKQTFSNGETVRKRGRTDITGKVMAQVGGDVVVDWSDGERALCDSRELVKT